MTVVVDGDSETFAPRAWFGPEVTGDPGWQRHTIALGGPPQLPDIPITDAAVESLLRAVESPAAAAAGITDWLSRRSPTS